MFSSSLNLVLEPVCAGNLFLFVSLTCGHSQPHLNYRASLATGSAAPVQQHKDFAEHEKKKALNLGFCLPFRCWLFTKSSFQSGIRISQYYMGSQGLSCVFCLLPHRCVQGVAPQVRRAWLSSVTSLIMALHPSTNILSLS